MSSQAGKLFSSTSILEIKPNQIIQCRGGIWKFLEEKKGFWHLELIRQGTHFSEKPIRAWALPQLEQESIRLLKPDEAYTPFPTAENKQKKETFSPFLRVREQRLLQNGPESKVPLIAKYCAIEEKSWQYEPWERIINTLPFPRLLLADDVGLGKTTEAAIILADLKRRKRAERVLIICPQHLCEKWQTELYERFGMVFEIYDRGTREKLIESGVKNPWEIVENVIVSRDFVKRWENLKPLRNVMWDMIVIDECHHFVKDKNSASKRLRQLAEEIVYNSPGLLLLSATPFTGKREQFESLLELLDPKFTDKFEVNRWDSSNPLMVRRTRSNIQESGEVFPNREVKHHEICLKDLSKRERKVLDQVGKEMEALKGRSDRQHWDRLVEEVARKRLSSSWAAFLETISGQKRLATWFSDETREAIHELIESGDSAKLQGLAAIINQIHSEEKNVKIVIFTEAIASLYAIKEYLIEQGYLKEGEIATIESSTSPVERLSIESDFENKSSELKILVATDTISEGKDLQHSCHHLVHFEMPWSFVRVEQRNGRIDRLGQSHTPYIHNLIFNTPITPDQRVLNRLFEKIQLAGEAIGSSSQIIASLEDSKLDFTNLPLKEVEDSVIKSIEEAKEEAKKVGFSFSDFKALSAAPIDDLSQLESRVSELQVMMGCVGVKMTPHGKAQDEYILTVPSDWEIRGLDKITDDLPIDPNSWRITFSSQKYLEYEKRRRQMGSDRIPLHFLSPIHPIMEQVQTRFRLLTERGGFPIFKVRGSLSEYIVLSELTVKSKTSKVLTQKIVALDLLNKKSIDLSQVRELTPINQPIALPKSKDWKSLEGHLKNLMAEFTEEVKKSYMPKYEKYRAEIRDNHSIPGELLGKRLDWLNDLWLVDEENSQYQVTALLIGGK